MATALAWLFILCWVLLKRQKQQQPPAFWRILIVLFIGLFSFDFNFLLKYNTIQIAILPLGVWLAYFFLRKKENAWETYRPYAWIGFVGNYVLLICLLAGWAIQSKVFPADDIQTYIPETTEVQLIALHPNIDTSQTIDVVIDPTNFTKQHFVASSIYEEVVLYQDEANTKEPFPYLLIGAEAKKGSNLSATIFVSRDGKGLLITTSETQYYYVSNESLLEEVGGND